MNSQDVKSAALSVAIVGAGAVGRSLAAAVEDSTNAVDVIISRTIESAKSLATELDIDSYSTNLAECLTADLIVLCVPDKTIALVADILASFQSELAGKTVLHTSGLETSNVLAKLREQGALVASFHPLQTFSRERFSAFHKLPIAVEGTPAEEAVASAFAVDIGAVPFVLSAKQKSQYHLAASVLSNYSVVLAHLAQSILNEPGMPDLSLFERLVDTTWANIFSKGPSESLTGPISRGDIGTVKRHLVYLDDSHPEIGKAYRVLAASAASMAQGDGMIDRGVHQDILALLHQKSGEKAGG